MPLCCDMALKHAASNSLWPPILLGGFHLLHPAAASPGPAGHAPPVCADSRRVGRAGGSRPCGTRAQPAGPRTNGGCAGLAGGAHAARPPCPAVHAERHGAPAGGRGGLGRGWLSGAGLQTVGMGCVRIDKQGPLVLEVKEACCSSCTYLLSPTVCRLSCALADGAEPAEPDAGSG